MVHTTILRFDGCNTQQLVAHVTGRAALFKKTAHVVCVAEQIDDRPELMQEMNIIVYVVLLTAVEIILFFPIVVSTFLSADRQNLKQEK